MSAAQIEAHHGAGMLRAFFDPKVIMLSLNYIGIVTASLGMLLFLPQIIKELGVSNMQVGWITMIPYICRRDQHGVLRLAVGPHRRPALEPVHDLRDLDGRADHRRADDRHLVGVGRHHDRRDRVLRNEGPVLVDADDVPDRRPRRPPASPGSTRSAISAGFSARRSSVGPRT